MMAESDSSAKLSTGAIGQDTNSAAIPKPDFKEDSKPELKVIDSMAGYTHDHEPPPRFWHFSQLVRDKVYVGGGCVPEFKSEEGRNSLTRIIEQFDVSNRSWHRLVTKGTPHPGLSAVACASFGNYLYAYGGSNLQRLSGVLSQLDLDTLTWSQLSPETKDGPMRKDASGMVHFSEDKLAVVCGYAHPNDLGNLKTGGSSDIKSEFIQRRIRKPAINDVGGWTNEMHIFSIKESSWCTPFFTGQRPPPCADFTLTSINNFRAILYGGDRGIYVDSQDLYLLDLKNLDISKVTPKLKEDKWPPLRMGQHVACCLGFNTDNPHLLISGGRLEKQHLPYKDMWLLNSTSWTWREVELPSDTVQNRLGRWGHTATTITHSEGLEEVIMFGGSRGLYEVTWDVKKKEDFHRWADPISFIFDKKMVLFKIIDTNQQKNDKKVMKENLYTISEIKMEESTTREKSLSTMEESYKIGLRGVDVCGESTRVKEITRSKFDVSDTVTLELDVKDMDTVTELPRDMEDKEDAHTEKKDKQQLPQANATVLRGVEVIAETTFVVTNKPQSFVWQGYGFKLHFPGGCLPEGTKECTINIKASLAGQYKFPETSHLVSAVFWLRCESRCMTFAKPISMEIQHCAREKNISKLCFMKAFCSPKKLPYDFEPQKDRDSCFNKSSSYGVIELDSFSGVAVIQKGSEDREYAAKLFYRMQNPTIASYDVHLVVTWNIEAHFTVIEKEYCEKQQFVKGPEQPLEFESEEIKLKGIAREGSTQLNGWQITPLTAPVIAKKYVDRYEPHKPLIPKCELSAKFIATAGESSIFLDLIGAKEPYNMFNIMLPTPGTGAISIDANIAAIPKSESNKDSKPELKDALKVLLPIASKWKTIGGLLGVDKSKLDNIKKDEGEVNECLQAMLSEWLGKKAPEPPTTWKTLADAVRPIDEALAEEIMRM